MKIARYFSQSPSRRRRRSGFMLLEAMLAVTIFALGVIALGRCVSYCVAAERLKEESVLARRLLENRWAEIEAGAVAPPKETTEEFDETSPFHALKLRITSVPIERKNEKEEKVEGIFGVTLTATWQSDGEEQSKELMFYVYPRPRQ